MKQKLDAIIQRKAVRQLIKYGMVGMVGLVIDMGIFYLLVEKYQVEYPFSLTLISLFGSGISFGMMNILISNLISQTIAIVNNFILNSYFTFRVTDNKLKRFASFAGVATIGVAISSLLLTLFIEVMGMPDMIAKIISIFIVAGLQFFINKLFTFKERK